MMTENLNKLNIAYIVPALANKGPILMVKELVSEFVKNGHTCTVFYFDEKTELDFDCAVHQIKFQKSIDFTLFDVVHSHGLRPDKYIYQNKHKFHSKILFTSTVHNYVMQDFKYQYNWFIAVFFGNLWMYWLKRQDKIVTLSQDAQKYYLRWFAKNKLTYAYNTRMPDVTKKLTTQELEELINFKGDSILLGVNALLSPVKGIDLLINSLAALPEYKLFIVGDGQSRRKLQKLALKCGISDRCYFAGYKIDAYRYLEYYDIFVLPSRSEGFPLSLLEASVYSVPTVGSDIAIIKEAFTAEEISFFELSNPLTIVDAIKNATGNSELGKRLHNKYRTSYSPEIMYKRYLAIYERKI